MLHDCLRHDNLGFSKVCRTDMSMTGMEKGRSTKVDSTSQCSDTVINNIMIFASWTSEKLQPTFRPTLYEKKSNEVPKTVIL